MGSNNRNEDLLKMALEDYIARTPSELKTKDELRAEGVELHQFSPEFDKKMARALRKSRKHTWFNRHKKSLRNIAACMVILVGISGVLIAHVDAIRVPLFSFILNIGSDSTELIGSNDGGLHIPDELTAYYPTYIPDGYTVTAFDETDNGFIVSYGSEDLSYFQLDYYADTENYTFDSEDSSVEKTTIQGHPAVISERDGRITVTWPVNEKMFSIVGNIESAEAIKILESIKF